MTHELTKKIEDEIKNNNLSIKDISRVLARIHERLGRLEKIVELIFNEKST